MSVFLKFALALEVSCLRPVRSLVVCWHDMCCDTNASASELLIMRATASVRMELSVWMNNSSLLIASGYMELLVSPVVVVSSLNKSIST